MERKKGFQFLSPQRILLFLLLDQLDELLITLSCLVDDYRGEMYSWDEGSGGEIDEPSSAASK